MEGLRRSVAAPLTVCELPRKKNVFPVVLGFEVGSIRPRRIPGEKQDGRQEQDGGEGFHRANRLTARTVRVRSSIRGGREPLNQALAR